MIPELENTPMPPQIAALPRDSRGYPFPYFATEADIRVTNPHKVIDCYVNRRCGICGGDWYYWMVFVSGPQAIEQRVSADPPMHEECARYAMKVCPYIIRPRAKRATDYNVSTVGSRAGDGVVFTDDRPDKFGMAVVRAVSIKYIRPGDIFRYGTPIRVEWQEVPK